jgi:hypothetical protein
VLNLATRLMSHGVKVIIDKWDLKEGQDKYVFMEQAVTDPEMDRVLLVCDKAYVEKADNRKGGVGDETMIISPEIYGKTQQEKFIPVVFEKDANNKPYVPAYIKSRIYVDLSEEDSYETEYEKLLRNIHSKPMYKKPALGNIPEWLEDEESDLSQLRDILKQIKGGANKGTGKTNSLIRRFNDSFIGAMSIYAIDPSGETLNGKIVVEKIEKMKPLRDLYIDFLECLLAEDVPLAEKITSFFENSYNGVFMLNGRSVNEFEHFRFLFWDMFICTVAFLFHYEKYADIKDLVSNTYFLKRYPSVEDEEPKDFTVFRPYFRLIDEDYKPKTENPRLYSLAADMLVKREKLPIFTKKRIVEADVLLCQLSHIHTNTYWFPQTYVYNENTGSMWKRLISKKYCEKTMVMYGTTNVSELREIAKNNDYKREMRYNSSFATAPSIATSIDIEKIGTLD